MPDKNRGMVNRFRLPTTMREYADIRFDVEQAFLVDDGLVAMTSRPGVCGKCLRVTAAKQSMRLKSLRLESAPYPRQKFTGGVFGYSFVCSVRIDHEKKRRLEAGVARR